ncbi:gephyrin-like molybdotransferase Glp [Sphingorhabdus sp.]|uniref:molybdopterin molybdotransferase MoeA n=1 Tax=Sphingorhabdus sp. TaxID=1902408 RepID=UPI003983D468
MISVNEAQARLLALASPLPSIELDLAKATQHYLSEPLAAIRTQPAADLSAMDGYAMSSADFPGPWRVIGESAAGHPFSGEVGAGEAVRIFTGAHLPQNADCVLIQENAARDGEILTAVDVTAPPPGTHVRRAGGDFMAGAPILPEGICLSAGPIALAAMAGFGAVPVVQWPRVAIVATGDELVAAGRHCGQAQIPSSNSPMLRAMLMDAPCEVHDAGIVADNLVELEARFKTLASQADIIVTTGGASVGDHDLVQPALLNIGARMDFWKVAIRPGKPLMAGQIGDTIVLGLPGNPSSAFVTAFLFLLPLVRHMAGCKNPFPEMHLATTGTDLPAGGERTEYVRARVENGTITVFGRQDSGMTAPLSLANALLVQPINVPARPEGSEVQYMRLS